MPAAVLAPVAATGHSRTVPARAVTRWHQTGEDERRLVPDRPTTITKAYSAAASLSARELKAAANARSGSGPGRSDRTFQNRSRSRRNALAPDRRRRAKKALCHTVRLMPPA
jgi:hypothetical protein